VHKRALEQWFLRITAYAQELLDGLEQLNWPEHIVSMQRNWIGQSRGIQFAMPIAGRSTSIEVYTTRPDTVYGITFVVLSPEHPIVSQIVSSERASEVEAYCQAAARRSDVARLSGEGSDSADGVFTGAYAVSPFTQAQVPIYVADYVLMSHGSGAVMAVPAHDQRDFEFAARHKIPAPVVVAPPEWREDNLERANTEPGTMVNSGPWDGLPSERAKEQISDWIVSQGIGHRATHYRMRDWLISRQRYWGAPIPIVYCSHCGTVLVPDDQLPVQLPDIEAWRPGPSGQSPLAAVPSFVETECPRCGGPARRETDTLDGFACSSWYFLRFTDPHFGDGPFNPRALAQWGAPDLYVGGAEHAVMHLLYARFWTKVMADAGLIPFREPFPLLRSQGVMHAVDPQTGRVARMSKSAGNVITPDSVAKEHGADALRIYLLFMAPFENNTVWQDEGIIGAKRFLQRTWRLVHAAADATHDLVDPDKPLSEELTEEAHRAIKRVTDDIEAFKFNTAVSALMEYLNLLTEHAQREEITAEWIRCVRTLVLLLAPFAPHIAEELWHRLGGSYSVHHQPWPEYDPQHVVQDSYTLIVQIDGRVRERLETKVGATQEQAIENAMQSSTVQEHLQGRDLRRVIFVPDRLVNLVTVSVQEKKA
jgi:leucyl-tRNA synthetase